MRLVSALQRLTILENVNVRLSEAPFLRRAVSGRLLADLFIASM